MIQDIKLWIDDVKVSELFHLFIKLSNDGIHISIRTDGNPEVQYYDEGIEVSAFLELDEWGNEDKPVSIEEIAEVLKKYHGVGLVFDETENEDRE